MNKAILALVIIGAAFATTSEDVLATIKRIDTNRFGKTLLDTIQIQLQTNDPLDSLIQTLADLEDGLTAEQKEDDDNNASFQASCDYDIKNLDQDLAESVNKKTILEARLEGQLYPTREILTSIVNTKTKEVNEYTLEISDLDNERSEDAAEFEGKVTEHEEATAVITEVRRLFTDNLQAEGGASVFLQKNQVNPKAFVTVETTILIQKHLLAAAKKASKNVHRKAYAKIFKVLATISAKAHQVADQGQVSGLIGLIDQLLAKISDSLDLERQAEAKRIDAYNKARRLLNITLTIASTTLANNQIALASVLDQITLAETSLENTNQRIENKTEERGDRYAQCESAAQEYQEAREQRTSDRSVVSDALGLINAQLRTLREQLALRQSAGDFSESD